jgi:hypothetical protein
MAPGCTGGRLEVSPRYQLDIVDNVQATSRTDLSREESLSTDSRWMTLIGVGTGVGMSPRQGLLPADSCGSQPGGPAFCQFPRHQEAAGQKGFPVSGSPFSLLGRGHLSAFCQRTERPTDLRPCE